MRVALKLLSLPVALIVAAAIGAVGPWGMPVGAVLLLGACVAGAVAMESQDLASVEGLAASTEPAPEPLLEAA